MRTMTVQDSYPVVEALFKQATGRDSIKVVDTSSFAVVAQQLDKMTYNQILPALGEVFSGIVISERPYNAKLRMLWRNMKDFGARRLKVSFLAENMEVESNPAWKIADGQTIGTHKVSLPKVYESTFWGRETLFASITIVRRQLHTAFSSDSEFTRFISGLMLNIENQLEQQKEQISRALLLNYVGGVYSFQASVQEDEKSIKMSTIHLLTEYKAQYGNEALTITDLRKDPRAYTQFISYCYKRMDSVAALMGNRDEYYHINPTKDPKAKGTAKVIYRHSSADNLQLMVARDWLTEIDTQVLTGLYNQQYLKMSEREEVLYWQDPMTPNKVIVTPVVATTAGSTKAAPQQTINDLFAVMYDRDAMGVGAVYEESADTAYDPEKQAYNRVWSLEVQPWIDYTEKGCIFVMD